VYRDILTSLAIGLLMDAFLVRTPTADPQTPPDQDLAAALCQP
jgi:hypothetical protein